MAFEALGAFLRTLVMRKKNVHLNAALDNDGTLS
jgi:hypothetical protein